MAAVTGYSRSKEREADLEGLKLMVMPDTNLVKRLNSSNI